MISEEPPQPKGGFFTRKTTTKAVPKSVPIVAPLEEKPPMLMKAASVSTETIDPSKILKSVSTMTMISHMHDILEALID